MATRPVMNSDGGSSPGHSPTPYGPLPNDLKSFNLNPPPEKEKSCTCCDVISEKIKSLYEKCVKCWREI